MGTQTIAVLLLFMVLSPLALPPAHACDSCNNPSPRPPIRSHHPTHGKKPPRRPSPAPPVTIPTPPIFNQPPAYSYPPYPPYTGGSPPAGGGVPTIIPPPPPSPQKCSIDALKLGLCLDVLGGLVHVGVGDPVKNVCCPVLGGLLELEAAVCLCTAIKLKVLNLNIYIPLALNVLLTCGKNPPPGYICPAL